MARRGTAIVETEQGILLNAMPRDSFLLPGGGANSSESRLQATVRELYEETGLRAYNAMYLFTFRSRKNEHRVFWVQAIGVPRPSQEIERIGYYQNGVITGIFDRKGTQFSNANMDKASESTRAIIKLFEEYKTKHPEIFRIAEVHQHIVEQQYAQRVYTPEDEHL
jgi:ADP-ribose pyrophosphatase YjhB (NUDIX family)